MVARRHQRAAGQRAGADEGPLARATKAIALPLLAAGEVVGATSITSPLRGTPFSCSAKPLRPIGVPAVQVPVPLRRTALLASSMSQL